MFKRETMKADSWKLSLGFGLLWNLFETQGSLGNKFLGLSFLWQNSMKVTIKVWFDCYFYMCDQSTSYLVYLHITFDPKSELQPQSWAFIWIFTLIVGMK